MAFQLDALVNAIAVRVSIMERVSIGTIGLRAIVGGPRLRDLFALMVRYVRLIIVNIRWLNFGS